MQTLKIVPLTDTAIIPTLGSPGSAGWDLYADEILAIPPLSRAMVATGICIALPDHTAGLIWPRSGLAYRYGIDVLAGVIDSDYTGPVNVVLQNHSDEWFTIQPGDRIAQLLIQPITQVNLMLVASLDDTQRGAGGFGSTGR